MTQVITRKLHNPKSNAPAIFIPCWLSQVPNKLVSHGAKIVYGRLSQWANCMGKAYRSVPQLATELGMCESSVEKYQKELRKCQLIGTYQPQAGGINHFEFYDHPWMHEPIHKNLCYETPPVKSSPPVKDYPPQKTIPPYNHTAPPVQSYGTPPYNRTDINIKEIKEIKESVCNTHTHPTDITFSEKESFSFPSLKVSESEGLQKIVTTDQTKKAKQEAITSPRNIATFNIRFTGRDLDIETLYDIAQEKFGRPNKPVGVAGLFQFIMTEKQERWPEKKTKQSTPQQSQVIDFETRERLQAELSEKKRTNFYQTFKHGKGDIPSTIQTASSAKHVGDLLSHLGGR